MHYAVILRLCVCFFVFVLLLFCFLLETMTELIYRKSTFHSFTYSRVYLGMKMGKCWRIFYFCSHFISSGRSILSVKEQQK